MAGICEHEFEREDKEHPGYSLMEYDLYAALEMTLRKNLKKGTYEIAKIQDRSLVESFNTLPEAVKRCNELEKADNTWIECRSSSCPKIGREREIEPQDNTAFKESRTEGYSDWIECSKCHEEIKNYNAKYCSQCGARFKDKIVEGQ